MISIRSSGFNVLTALFESNNLEGKESFPTKYVILNRELNCASSTINVNRSSRAFCL